MRSLATAAMTVLALLSGCSATTTDAAPSPAASSSSPVPVIESPSPSPSPSPSASPSPSPSPTPSPKPATTTKPRTGPISCNGHATLTRSPATGTGPGGSLLTTGSTGVALTFDDGPDPVYTPKILDMLKQCGVKATFCVVGFRARDNPALIQRIYNEGHTICNHSWQHLFDLAKRTDEYVLKDLRATNNAIHKAVPGAPIAYFRAPGGNFTKHLVALADSLGMKSIYWKIDTRDWESSRYGHGTSMVNHIISVVESEVRPGAIILSHDLAKPDTITAYRTLLPWLDARFTLIPLPVTSP